MLLTGGETISRKNRMRASSATATHLPLAAAAALVFASLPRLSEGFLGSSSTTTTTTYTGQQRLRVPRMALTPPRKPNGSGVGAGAGSAAAGGDETGKTPFGGDDIFASSKIARAPLRITPNFQPREKRRPKTDQPWDLTHGAFLTEESFDIAAMAWEEFSDFLRRTVERNVNGAKFDFDTRQWSSSIRKWWSRAIEMDVQAKADLFKLYDSSVGQRDAWGHQALKVDARVEDEWDSIYVDCQDSVDIDFVDYSSDAGYLSEDGSSGFGSMGGGTECGETEGRDIWSAASLEPAATSPSQTEREGGRWGARSSVSSGGSRSALMAAMEAYQAAEEEAEGEEEEREGENKGFDKEEIIDCAIRGRWTFKTRDDPPHFLPQ